MTQLGSASALTGALSSAPRFEYVDGVRAAAAMYVVLHHIWLAVWPGYPANDGPWWTGWLVFGHIAVAIFIVVSGFSLGLSPAMHGHKLKGGTKEFFRRRAWRILPAYWAALVLSIAVVSITGPDASGEVSVYGTATHAFLVQNIFGGASPNPVFWSIAVEAQIYLFFPLLLIFRRRLGLTLTVLLAVVGTTVLHVLSAQVGLERTQTLVQFAGLFVIGMAGAEIALRWRNTDQRRWGRVAAVAALGVCVWVAVVGSVTAITYVFWLELVIAFVVVLWLATLADTTPRLTRRALESAPMRWMGSISYSIYLIHGVFLRLLWEFIVKGLDLPPELQFLVFVALAVPLVLLTSHVFSRCIERPTQRYRSFRSLWNALRAWVTKPRLRVRSRAIDIVPPEPAA